MEIMIPAIEATRIDMPQSAPLVDDGIVRIRGGKLMWKPLLPSVCLAASLLSVGCQSPGLGERSQRPSTTENSERRDQVLQQGVPRPYRDKRNPLKATIGALAEGSRHYDLHCTVCHGVMGMGDGAASAALDIGPADLDRSLGNPRYADAFFYWSIAEGGARFGTDMPSFKDDMSEHEIWSIVTFMRSTFIERRNVLRRAKDKQD
jgi:hypothetical protein